MAEIRPTRQTGEMRTIGWDDESSPRSPPKSDSGAMSSLGRRPQRFTALAQYSTVWYNTWLPGADYSRGNPLKHTR